MKSCFAILLLANHLPAFAQATSDPSVRQTTLARLSGSGVDSIQALATDSRGNIYVAGTTSSPDFPVTNAIQPFMGDELLMRTDDLGASWMKVPYSVPAMSAVTANLSDPLELFGVGRGGSYKTSDGGRNWRRVWNGNMTQVVIDPGNKRLVYAYGGNPVEYLLSAVIASNDGGETWNSRAAPPQYFYHANSLWADPFGSGAIGSDLFLSLDRAVSWTPFNQEPFFGSLTRPSPWRSGQLYAIGLGNFYASDDWGESWALRDRADSTQYIAGVRFDPDRAGRVYQLRTTLSGGRAPRVSTNFGASWVDLSGPPLDTAAIVREQCDGGALIGAGGGLLSVSKDRGATWQSQPTARVSDVLTGAGCSVYLVREPTTDAFVAKVSPSGEVLWATFLGGAKADVALALAVDAWDNVYVVGNTESPDFPMTRPRYGVSGASSGFLTKFDSAGVVQYSNVFGGELQDKVTGLAVDAAGRAYVTGWTTSQEFPVTSGAAQTKPGPSDGFAVSFDEQGEIVYATYLPGFSVQLLQMQFQAPPLPRSSVAVTAEEGGSILTGGSNGMLAKLSADGSAMTVLATQPGEISVMATDPNGDIYLAGRYRGSGLQSGACFYGFYYNAPTYTPAGDVYVAKLSRGSLDPQSFTHVGGACQAIANGISIGPGGTVNVTAAAAAGFPLTNPVSQGAFGNYGTGYLFQADAGGAVTFATYLDYGGPSAAVGPDAIYAVAGISAGHPELVRVPVKRPGGLWISVARDAFGGGRGVIAPGTMLRIEGGNFSEQTVEMALNSGDPLPVRLPAFRCCSMAWPPGYFGWRQIT